MNKKKKLIVVLIIIGVIILINLMINFFTLNYTIDFNKNIQLTQLEYNEIKNIINTENNIEITRISYNKPFRHESFFYICYTDKVKNEDHIFYKVVLNTNEEKDFITIKKICNKYYRWWRKSENNKIDKLVNNMVTSEDIVIKN